MPNKKIVMHNPERHPAYMHNQTQKIPVGWCSHNKHRGKLSVKQLKNHKWISKQCPFFTKNPRHNYWEQKEHIKESKRKKKFESRFSETLLEEIKRSLDALT